ncbi:MAG: hypothetical protein NTV22_04920 [bacterium]|nr:hypothetical protein [bacterium]
MKPKQDERSPLPADIIALTTSAGYPILARELWLYRKFAKGLPLYVQQILDAMESLFTARAKIWQEKCPRFIPRAGHEIENAKRDGIHDGAGFMCSAAHDTLHKLLTEALHRWNTDAHHDDQEGLVRCIQKLRKTMAILKDRLPDGTVILPNASRISSRLCYKKSYITRQIAAKEKG